MSLTPAGTLARRQPIGRACRHGGAVAALVVLISAAPASAQFRADTTDQRLFPLVTFSQASAAQKKKPPKKQPWFRWEDHPTVHVGKVSVAFRARVKLDTRRSDAPLADEKDLTLDLARRRVGIEGEVAGYADYQVERELSDDLDPWRDVFVNYSQFDQIQLQYGKFKLPFSLDENTGATNLDFAYRSLAASILAPGRDRGWMVHGRVVDRIVQYEFGIFEHDGRNSRPKRSDRVFGGETRAGRLSVQPFRASKSPAEDFLVGAAWTSSEVPEGFSSVRGQTVFGQSFFPSDYWMLGRRKRLGFELRWRPGPFSVKAEYMKVTEERLGESVEDTDLSPLRAVGWYVSGTWAVTGDKKADGLDAPKHPLFQGGIGAVEVAGRVERITFDSVATGEAPSTSPRADVIIGNSNRVVTLGANWYPNRWVKIQFNLIQETLADPTLGPLPTQPQFWSRVLRFQFQL